jgi:hypothetical protein
MYSKQNETNDTQTYNHTRRQSMRSSHAYRDQIKVNISQVTREGVAIKQNNSSTHESLMKISLLLLLVDVVGRGLIVGRRLAGSEPVVDLVLRRLGRVGAVADVAALL